MNKIVSILLKVLLTILILFLGYRLYDEIFSPYFFEKAMERRYQAVKEQMDDIIKAQNKFNEVADSFAGSFDTLEYVLKNKSIAQIRSIGATADTVVILGVEEGIEFFDIDKDLQGEALFQKLTERIAEYNQQLRDEGGDQVTSYKVEDTSYVPIVQTFTLNTPIDSLRYIPYSKGDTFTLESDFITVGQGRIKVPVYEVVAYNKSILKGLDPRFWNPEAGIKLGSLNQAITDIRNFNAGEE